MCGPSTNETGRSGLELLVDEKSLDTFYISLCFRATASPHPVWKFRLNFLNSCTDRRFLGARTGVRYRPGRASHSSCLYSSLGSAVAVFMRHDLAEPDRFWHRNFTPCIHHLTRLLHYRQAALPTSMSSTRKTDHFMSMMRGRHL